MRGSSRSGRQLAVLCALAAAAIASGAACGTEAVGVEACRKIERVRCESAPGCGISLERPVHEGTGDPQRDVAACIRYYDDQCLHGNVHERRGLDPRDPPPQDVDACVQAIITGDCNVVKTPESHPACAFLVPPAPAPAAPPDAGAADAS